MLTKTILTRFSACLCTAAALGGCIGSSLQSPPPVRDGLKANGSSTASIGLAHHFSSSGDYLVYLMGSGGIVYYTYDSSGLHRLNSIGGIPSAISMCDGVDGTVWVVNQGYISKVGTGYVEEFPHGQSSPITQLTDPYGIPSACAVDPATGNVAAAETHVPGGYADVVVWANGTPTYYRDPNIYGIAGLAYAGSSNLLVDGPHSISGTYYLDVLPGGSSTFQNVGSFNTYLGRLQFDGVDIVAGVSDSRQLYRLAGGSIAKKIRLKDGFCGDYFVSGDTVWAVNSKGGCNKPHFELQVYKYPHARAPIYTYNISDFSTNLSDMVESTPVP